MSEENVEIVRRAIAAVNKRDVDGYLGLCAPNVELITRLRRSKDRTSVPREFASSS
jgi:ketosteroid isomerase-like protein